MSLQGWVPIRSNKQLLAARDLISGQRSITLSCLVGICYYFIPLLWTQLFTIFLVSSSSHLSDFVPHIVSLSSCPTYTVRVVAANALVPFIPDDHLLEKAKELILLLPGPVQRLSQNVLHGTLLQIRSLLGAVKWSTVSKDGRGVLNEMLNKIWICSCSNGCPLTRASFLDIVMRFGPVLGQDWECGKCFFVCMFVCFVLMFS